VDNPLPVEAYLSLMGKYRHLDKEQFGHIQEATDQRIEVIKRFGGNGGGEEAETVKKSRTA
jgi:hypothetical protein